MTGKTTTTATTTTTTEIYCLLWPGKEYFTVPVPLLRESYHTSRLFHGFVCWFPTSSLIDGGVFYSRAVSQTSAGETDKILSQGWDCRHSERWAPRNFFHLFLPSPLANELFGAKVTREIRERSLLWLFSWSQTEVTWMVTKTFL